MSTTQKSKLNPPELHVALMEVPARVAVCVHLRTAVVDCCYPDELEDILDLIDEEELVELWPKMPPEALESFLSCEWDEIEAWVNDLKLFGFLVQVATPVVGKDGSYSWGMSTSKLFYADTYDDALRAALPWAEAERKKRRKP